MRGGVRLMKTAMEHIKKAVCIAKAYLLNKVLRTIFVFGLDLMILFARSIKKLFAWMLSNIKQKLVPQIIQEDFNTVDNFFVTKRLGLIGRSVLTTVLLIPLAALKHLCLGLWRVLVVMKDKLLKRG